MIKNIPTSGFNSFCTGYQNPENQGSGYILALCLEIGKVPVQFRHPGSEMLDKTNAFDMAEASGTYLGQINMIQVSSFCGIQGKIWGYDIAKHSKLKKKSSLLISKVTQFNGKKVSVFNADPLIEAGKKLIGTKTHKRFPILPGSHVPCATKNITKTGPCHLYCALAIGIPMDRKRDACLLMEDIGEIGNGSTNSELLESNRQNILDGVAKSILAVGSNQNILYREIFVKLIDVIVPGGEIGCALVAAPYIALAQKVIPKNIDTLEQLGKLTLEQWEKSVKKDFLNT